MIESRVILLPGASGGIGSEILRTLLQRGCFVVAGCQSRKQKLLQWIEQHNAGKRVIVVEGDLLNPATRKEYLDMALARWGRIDGLVDCSGIPCRTSLEEIEKEESLRVFETNSIGPLLLARDLAAKLTRRNESSSIVHFSSQHALSLSAGKEIYALSKKLLSEFNRLLARQYPTIRFNEIVLGALGIGMSAATKSAYPNHIVPLEDLISAVLYLLDPQASSGLTGSSLRLDRGFSLPYYR